MSETPTTPTQLLAHWTERAETLRASGRLEAAEERERACAELSAFVAALTSQLMPATENDAAEVRPLGPWPTVRPLELPTKETT